MKNHSQAGRVGGASFIVTLLAATFLMGSSFVVGKILLRNGFPPTVLVGWRFLVAALATLPLIPFDGGRMRDVLPGRPGLRAALVIASIGFLQTTAVMGLLFLAMRWISASTAAILLFTNPIWVALLGKLFLREQLGRSRIVGLVLGLAGVVLAIGMKPESWSGTTALMGELLGLGSALCWAAATIINKRADLDVGAWALSFWQMLVGALALLAIASLLGERWPQTTTLSEWTYFIWLAIPASTGSFGLWFVALRKGGATRTSSFLFLAPFFTVVLSFMFLGETLTPLQGAGGALIGLAIWLVNRESKARMPTVTAASN